MEGIGTTTLAIFGKSLNQEYSFQLSEDPIEAMFFLTAANRDEIVNRYQAMPAGFSGIELYKLEKIGFKYKIMEEYKSENGFARLADIKNIYPSELSAGRKIYGRPYPRTQHRQSPFSFTPRKPLEKL